MLSSLVINVPVVICTVSSVAVDSNSSVDIGTDGCSDSVVIISVVSVVSQIEFPEVNDEYSPDVLAAVSNVVVIVTESGNVDISVLSGVIVDQVDSVNDVGSSDCDEVPVKESVSIDDVEWKVDSGVVFTSEVSSGHSEMVVVTMTVSVEDGPVDDR